MPIWLHFNSGTNELTGVPTASDKGTCILSAGKEMFAISVVEPTKSQVAQPVDSFTEIICKPQDSITVVYVKLNADTDALSADKRSRLVRDLSAYLSLQPNHVFMAGKPKDLAESSAALVSGNGDMAPADVLSTLGWIAGCGAVKSNHMDILEKLETSAKTGEMSKVLGIPVSGWQVQSNQPKVLSKRRLRRNVLVTATPSPSVPGKPVSIYHTSAFEGQIFYKTNYLG